MPLETEPRRSPERYPQLIDDPVHRFGFYHPGENLMVLLSGFTIGEVAELQVLEGLSIMRPCTWSTTLCGSL